METNQLKINKQIKMITFAMQRFYVPNVTQDNE